MSNQNITLPINAYIKGRRIIILGEFTSSEPNELINEAYYIFNGKVWRYEKKLPNSAKEYPMISYDKDKNIMTKPDIDGVEITLESVLNGRLNIICERTAEDADFSKDLNIASVASSSSIYEPVISEEDDFLKRLIKTVFLIKKVPTTKYRKKLSKTYAFSNLFQGLNSSTKISTIVWQTWIEILGIDCIIILKDSGDDKEDPINDYIVYKSRNDSLNVIKKDEISDFVSENL